MNIDAYTFGRMVIDGTAYTSDLIIFPEGRIEDSWWRRSGHRLCLEDIARLTAAAPSELIVGTGANGMMRPDPGLEDALNAKGVTLRACPTAEAVTVFNSRQASQRIGACFHLTC